VKILQLTAHFSPNLGGVETHLDDLVSALTKRNHKVVVLTYRPLISRVFWKMHETEKDLQIFRVPWFPGLFYKLVKKPIFEFLYLVPGLFVVCPFIIFVGRIDVIQTHGLIASFVGVFWGKIFRKRVVSTTHSIYAFPEKGIYRTFVKWIFKNSSAVLTLSEQSKKEIETLDIEKDKVKVFTYWVDLKNFKPKENKKAARRKFGFKARFVVLFVGRLVPEKGLAQLLRSFRKWNEDVGLVVVGDGPMKGWVEKVEDDCENLRFVGRIDQKKLPEYYTSSDVTIVPSIHEEGYGRVIIESLACGIPVIGSNRGGITEALDDSVGRLINISPESIKDTVEGFYYKPRLLEGLAKNTIKFAHKHYSEKNVETIINSYSN